jgi:hypothetical protein
LFNASTSVNRSSKLFIAAVLLAAGYGLASLLGSPNAPYLSRPSYDSPAAGGFDSTASTARPTGAAENRVVGAVRLLPDLSDMMGRKDIETNGPAAASKPASVAVSPPPDMPPMANSPPLSAPPLANVATGATASVLPPPLAFESAGSSVEATSALRAKLIDTTPRPVRVHAPTETLATQPASIRPPGLVATARDAASAEAESARPSKAEPAIIKRLPPVSAASSPPANELASLERFPSAPPLPSQRPPQAAPERTHIIVDGDSLPKLAKRYLSDAEKSSEIFAANRHLLTSPDLLPIGAELKIPATVKASGRGG